ncbi:hypothetical protein [Streptococcus sp. sy018]|uniref:hypothetical protein n=1 Tax=Streptococcus sp. sy018 TaxID=2600147 RepID=UPI0011B72BDC|nr:hypothetical protein [Streptococcus sp. sy018]TWS94383.1 hypothetical protein FRX52_04385 [Streptococcus sp. sy018]
MIDYLFVSPLGWSQHVWDKLLKFPVFAKGKCDFVNFLDESFSAITQEEVEASLLEKMKNLSSSGTVIASSYGSLVTLSVLAKAQLPIARLVLISGLEEVPSQADLDEMFQKVVDESYTDISGYLDMMLTGEEQKDSILCQILEYNLQKKEESFQPLLSQFNIYAYLSIYAGLNPSYLLEQVNQLVKQLTVFSEQTLTVSHIKILPEDHLLMLTQPKLLYHHLINP